MLHTTIKDGNLTEKPQSDLIKKITSDASNVMQIPIDFLCVNQEIT